MLGIIVAILSGMLMSVQGVFNTALTKQSSLWVASGWAQCTAFVVCVVAWYVTGREAIEPLWQVSPKYMLLSGVLGALITITVVISMGSLGPAQSTIFIVSAQVILSYVIELFGIFGVERQPFDWKKVMGAAIVVLGIVIFKWK